MHSINDEELEDFRVLLETLRNQLDQQIELGSSNAGVVTLDQSRVGRLSRMDAMQQQQMAESGLVQARRRLQDVKQALRRIDEGEYGICCQCDEVIAVGRLLIHPAARLCLQCQGNMES